MSTYPNGLQVEKRLRPEPGNHPEYPNTDISWRPPWTVCEVVRTGYFVKTVNPDVAEFVARCIRLANPPDPATRQVWLDKQGRLRVAGRPARSYHPLRRALREWHDANGGKP